MYRFNHKNTTQHDFSQDDLNVLNKAYDNIYSDFKKIADDDLVIRCSISSRILITFLNNINLSLSLLEARAREKLKFLNDSARI